MKARSLPAQRVVLSAAYVADLVERGDVPTRKTLFLLAAATVEAADGADLRALTTAIDSTAALLNGLPDGEKWGVCRGQLLATMQFAWLLKELGSGRRDELRFTNEQKGKERDAPDDHQ